MTFGESQVLQADNETTIAPTAGFFMAPIGALDVKVGICVLVIDATE